MLHKRLSKVVKTKMGKIGRTYNDSAILCRRESLQLIGFID